MIVSVKDGFKLIGVTLICFCAVFVCSLFLNYYMDLAPLKESVSAELMPLYEAQLATSKITCGIAGGFLSVVSVLVLFFYIKLYIDGHRKAIGTFKAMGYPDFKIARGFTCFGLSVFLGCAMGVAVGWACMPSIYRTLTIAGLPEVAARFHTELFICLVFVPAIVFAAAAFIYALIRLNKPALALIGGVRTAKNVRAARKMTDRPFLKEMCISTLKSRKIFVFFVAFSCFCFSAMVQMGLSMENLASGTMGVMILAIGVVLAAVSMFMAMTSLVKNNAQNIAVMKAMGFSMRQCFISVFLGYIPFGFLGFAVGTGYQYGLLCLMVNQIFGDVEFMPQYRFHVPIFFITLSLFIVSYAAVFAWGLSRVSRLSLKEIMLDGVL